MKKIFILFFFIVLIGCSRHIPMGRKVFFLGFDFSPYSQKGFLFTPEKYSGDYQSMGLIYCYIFPGDKKVAITTENKDTRQDNIYYLRESEVDVWELEKIQPDEILQIVYDRCIKMGADAFVNFKYEAITVPKIVFPYSFETHLYIIEGFAIKREN